MTKSARSREDAQAPLGIATTDSDLRMLASLGKLASAPTDFQRPCESVTHGGVLFALPALLASGLLRHAARFFSLPAGYYGLEHIFLLLGMLANLDRLIDYQLEPVDETTRIVNPTWRRLDGQVRRSATLQHRRKARLHDLEVQGALDAAKTEHYLSRAEALRSGIEAAATALKTLKEQRKAAGKHTTVSELPEAEKFLKLATRSKHFIDTISCCFRCHATMSGPAKNWCACWRRGTGGMRRGSGWFGRRMRWRGRRR